MLRYFNYQIIEYEATCVNVYKGIIRRNVCGSAGCGQVGGMGCSQRPGGAEKCCVGRIREEAQGKGLCKKKSDVPCVLYNLGGKQKD